MADVCFDPTQCQSPRGVASCECRKSERARLQRVPERSARAMSLDIRELLGRDCCISERSLEKGLLSESVWRREACTSPILTNAAADQAQLRLITSLLTVALQNCGVACLGSHVTICTNIECMAATKSRRHACNSEAHANLGNEHKVNCCYERAIAVHTLQGTTSGVRCHES